MQKTWHLPVLALVFSIILVVPVFAQKGGDAQPSLSAYIDADLQAKYDVNPRSKEYVLINVGPNAENLDVIVNELGNKVDDYYLGSDAFPYGVVGAYLNEREAEALIAKHANKFVNIQEMPLFEAQLEEVVDITNAEDVWPMQVDTSVIDGSGKTVCVIDSGVDFTHPDLAAKNIAGNNYDCYTPGGVQTCVADPTPSITDAHGTRMAGIAGANGGAIGVAPGVNLISMQVFEPSNPLADYVDVLRGMGWCADPVNVAAYNIEVISMSLGTQTEYASSCNADFPGYEIRVDEATAAGVHVVASTGNGFNYSAISAPACISDIIAVSATMDDDTPRVSANYNQDTLLFAPGDSVTSTELGGGYATTGGTSAAAPVVAAGIAMLEQISDAQGVTRTSSDLESLLFTTGDPVVGLPTTQYARVNILEAVLSLEEPFMRGDANNDGAHDISDAVRILQYLFNQPTNFAASCLDANDANDDGTVNIADVVYTLSYLFEGGPDFPAPFTNVGGDATDTDTLRCF